MRESFSQTGRFWIGSEIGNYGRLWKELQRVFREMAEYRYVAIKLALFAGKGRGKAEFITSIAFRISAPEHTGYLLF